jgi:hypothetical protein
MKKIKEKFKGLSFRRGYEMGRREVVEAIKSKLPKEKLPSCNVIDNDMTLRGNEITLKNWGYNSCLSEITTIINNL